MGCSWAAPDSQPESRFYHRESLRQSNGRHTGPPIERARTSRFRIPQFRTSQFPDLTIVDLLGTTCHRASACPRSGTRAIAGTPGRRHAYGSIWPAKEATSMSDVSAIGGPRKMQILGRALDSLLDRVLDPGRQERTVLGL